MPDHVALRKESVDRNLGTNTILYMTVMSLSARRAWIEICTALTDITLIGKSLSARRAWIEIEEVSKYVVKDSVALRKESVDRNST